MRGKLRDKRADARQERTSRDRQERRRPAKRGNRAGILLNRQLEDDYLPDNEVESYDYQLASK